jgi:hypothetical protein
MNTAVLIDLPEGGFAHGRAETLVGEEGGFAVAGACPD